MWESIKDILTSSNGIAVSIILLFILIILLFVIIKLVNRGYLRIHGKHIKMGKGISERELIRRQVEVAHEFVMSIEGKLDSAQLKYDGYFLKFILERVYDKVIEWIIFNHITTNQLYIQDKQETVCNLIYGLNIDKEFKTPEFKKRVCNWTKELIEKLVQTKTLYGNN